MSFSRTLIFLLAVAVICWLSGLVLFVGQIEQMDVPAVNGTLEETDAIVVLTGGSDRVPEGVALLNAGKAKKLFISGVHSGLTLDAVIGNQAVAKDLKSCCIALGHTAESTLGNVDETRTWLAVEDYKSMRLVTANYHMLRSLMLFRDALPDILIVPHPVAPESVKLEGWWERPGTASLLITEYNKYLWAVLRLWSGHHA